MEFTFIYTPGCFEYHCNIYTSGTWLDTVSVQELRKLDAGALAKHTFFENRPNKIKLGTSCQHTIYIQCIEHIQNIWHHL